MKKLSLSLDKILVAFGILLSIVALFFFLAPGLIATETQSGITATSILGLGGFLVGNHKMVTTATASTSTMTITVFAKGGMSYFVLISFIFLLIGLIFVVLSFFFSKESKLFAIVGATLILIAAIFILLIKCGGTNITSLTYQNKTTDSNTTYADFIKDTKFGAGTICYFIFNLLGAISILVGKFVPFKKLLK